MVLLLLYRVAKISVARLVEEAAVLVLARVFGVQLSARGHADCLE